MKLHLVLVAWVAFVVMFLLVSGYFYLTTGLNSITMFEYFSCLVWSLPVVFVTVIVSHYVEKHRHMVRKA